MCRMKKNIFAVLAACFLIILSIQFTKAATRNWIGTTTSNDFSVASNWHEGVVPIAGDVVQVGVRIHLYSAQQAQPA